MLFKDIIPLKSTDFGFNLKKLTSVRLRIESLVLEKMTVLHSKLK